jgi:hypothetical protein
MKPTNPVSPAGAYSRRDLLGASAASALAMSPGIAASAANSGAASSRGQVRSEILTFDDPVEEFRQYLRIERSLVEDEGSTLTWYNWIAFVVAEGRAPFPLVRFEGIEYSYYRRVAPMEFRIHAHNLSYARDLKTGEFLQQIENPLTGRLLKVEPAVLLTDPGVIASPRGFRNLKSDGRTWRQPFRVFRIQDDLIKFDSVRTAPPDMPTVHIENSCQWVSRRLFDDASINSLPVEFAGVYLFPFPKWLEMGDRKGHMYGMWDGRKLGGPADLPAEFRRRTEREFPELLAPRWKEFERPIPFPL